MNQPDPVTDPVTDVVRSFARTRAVPLDGDLDLAGLWRALVEDGDPAPGLSFADWVAPAAIGGPLLPLLSNSPRLGELLEQLTRFHPLFGRERITLQRNRSGLVLTLDAADGGRAEPDTVDACFGLLVRIARVLTAAEAPPAHDAAADVPRDGIPPADAPVQQVLLRRPTPPSDVVTRRYGDAFGAVGFGADRDECRFDAAALDAAIVGADPMMLRLVQPYAERQIAEQGRRWTTAVTRALTATTTPPAGMRTSPGMRTSAGAELAEFAVPGLPDVARSLAVSPRSLQDYLRAEGTTFSALLDGVQRDRALALLAAGDLVLTAIAPRVGFSTPAAFTRAVRRWTGMSPSAYRTHVRAGGALSAAGDTDAGV